MKILTISKKIKGTVFTLFICFTGFTIQAQQMLWFGTVKIGEKISQGRFEVFLDSIEKTIVYAPYGITPVTFKNVKQQDKLLEFSWLYNYRTYHCTLLKQEVVEYKGKCICENGQSIDLVMREFNMEDEILQGNKLQPSQTDIQILERALTLMNKGHDWNRVDNRVCDNSSYPYKWSLFCALHQASIDIGIEYQHLRPAIKAARQAIEEATAGKKFAHLLQDFNNEAKSFESIDNVLRRAKEIIENKITTNK